MRLIDAHALRTAYEDEMKELVKATNVENVTLETLSLLCGAKLIQEAPTVGGWINVKDRLPDKEDCYLAYGAKGCDILFYDAAITGSWLSMGHTLADGEVTYWMPLPNPPKEEGNDD